MQLTCDPVEFAAVVSSPAGIKGKSKQKSPASGGKKREIVGIARMDRRTKDLVKRLADKDIAVIDHRNIDAISAEELVASGVRAVVNNSQSTTGEYPNAGPLILVDAGVHLLDVADTDLFEIVKDGDQICLAVDKLVRDGTVVATGKVQEKDTLEGIVDSSRRRIGHALEQFAANTMTHLREEVGLLSENIELPDIDTKFRDRHALVVVRGVGYKRDLKALRPYIRDMRPVLVGVDGGGDALLEVGLKPSLIVGDMDSASDRALHSGAELVVHAYLDGRAPGVDRLERLGVDHKLLSMTGTSQDVAMLLAYEMGASLIVSVGSHFNLVEFMDKDRRGMSSTFLTRLRIGETLVDTKGVSRLYRPSPGRAQMMLLLAVALVTVIVVVFTSPQLERLADLIWLKIRVTLGI